MNKKLVINKDRLIMFSFFCTSSIKNEDVLYCNKSLDAIKSIYQGDIEDNAFTEIKIFHKALSWGDKNSLMSNVVKVKNNLEIDVDFNKYKSLLVKTLIKEWNIQDDEGKILPCNEDTIANLNPVIGDFIAEYLLLRYPIN